MQLNDILEENSIKMMSNKTKISEENLENLLGQNFEAIKKIKTLGFISIIEREYRADLSPLRDAAQEYYGGMMEDQRITLGRPIVEEKKGKSKFFMLVVLALLGYATWYFLTQFDKKNLSGLISFIDENAIENFMEDKSDTADKLEELSIAKVSLAPKRVTAQTGTSESVETHTEVVQSNTDETVSVTQTVEDITPVMETKKIVSIVPVNRIWFGLVDMETKQREHFSIAEPYELDVTEKSVLVATSSAPFSLLEFDETKEFNDAKEHYFKIDANGIEVLNKSDYVALGGWPQW